MKLQHGEFFKVFFSQRLLDLIFGPLCLFLDIKTDQIDVVFGLPTSSGRDSAECQYDIIGSKKMTYPIFVVGGGGRPLTPEICTLSGPICAILRPEMSAATSDP